MRAGPPKTFEVASSAFQLAVDCGSALVALEKSSPPHRRTRGTATWASRPAAGVSPPFRSPPLTSTASTPVATPHARIVMSRSPAGRSLTSPRTGAGPHPGLLRALCGTGSTATAPGRSTRRSTRSRSATSAPELKPGPTTSANAPRARPAAKRCAASDGGSPTSSTGPPEPAFAQANGRPIERESDWHSWRGPPARRRRVRSSTTRRATHRRNPGAPRERPPAGGHEAARPQPDAHDHGHLQPRHACPGPRSGRPGVAQGTRTPDPHTARPS
jgi:hypothetical protein